ncbi:small nuclear ribonucleoprotein polypeptide F [Columba livia]|uniref:Small nuclear ribonucleoprotein polypeptide F n=83 Tax=Aves TaxID=8782 RepID=A0A2I0LUK7_COLLI|nr:small nuclear ribonucleoprotein polypeptide F [Columba livia]
MCVEPPKRSDLRIYSQARLAVASQVTRGELPRRGRLPLGGTASSERGSPEEERHPLGRTPTPAPAGPARRGPPPAGPGGGLEGKVSSFITIPTLAGFLLKLANTEEYIDGALSGHLGEVLIRCNNVLYIRGVEEEEEDGEMRE